MSFACVHLAELELFACVGYVQMSVCFFIRLPLVHEPEIYTSTLSLDSRHM